ncbi:MAG: LPS assembly protein LptD [Gallionella sp.]|nr:LPS assembly protein LptD [Gallionella sp.]
MRFRVLPTLASLLFCVMHNAHAATAASGVPAVPGETEAVLDADSLVGQKDNQIEATGEATLRKDGKLIRADKLLYMPNEREVDAQGGVLLEQPSGDKISGPHLHMNMTTGRGEMEQPQFKFQGDFGRASGSVMEIQDKQHYSLDNATYTTCPAGNDDWQLNMGTLQLDRVDQVGTAHNATVEFKGVPFIYAPWMDFPLDSGRKSGFLAPIQGTTSNGGLDVTLPYYWNIAPNADATIAPREISKRGVQLNNEFRYLGAGYSGILNADLLPNDHLTNSNREHFAVKHNQAIDSSTSGYVNYERVSDNAYYTDLGTSIFSTAQVNLLQEAGAKFNADGWNSSIRVQQYQTLQDPAAPIVAPYARMPELNTSTATNLSGATLAFTGQYVDFVHPTMVDGSRLTLAPSLSYPLVSEPAVYVTPKLTLSSTQYTMGANNLAGLPNASRNLPLFSVDSGMSFERDANFFGSDYLQTLEPRALYLYVPYRNQTLLPNFDTALPDFNQTQMFSENRFVGGDLIGDANQITLATTTRVLSKNSGAELFNLTLGQRFSFITPQVTLNTPGASMGISDTLLAVSGSMTRTLSLETAIDYNNSTSGTQQYSWVAHYRPEPGKTFNFGYQYQRDIYQQIDISQQWPISQHWGTVARMNYSFLDKRLLNAVGGLEYNQSCWALRFVAQRFVTTTFQSITGFFVQLELNNFMPFGTGDPISVLRQSIPGYSKVNDNHASPQVTP